MLAGAASMAQQEVVLPVAEDSWIHGLNSTTADGSDPTLGICPVAHYRIYLKFDLTQVPGEVLGAELRLLRFSGSRPNEISLYRIVDDNWTEATLTGVNRPEPRDPANDTALAVGEELANYDRWISAALTSAVQGEAEGDGTLSLMLREDPGQVLDIRYYRSKESGVPAGDRPRLAVTCRTAEVGSVMALGSAPSSYGWDSAGAGLAWDVAGGSLADLRADGGVAGATCLANGLATPEFVDMRPEPLPGEGDYFIVRAVGPCGGGDWGPGAGGAPREPLAACP